MEDQRGQKTLAIVCSFSYGINPGVSSEHLGWHAFAKRNGYNLKYYTLYSFEQYFSKSNEPNAAQELHLIKEYVRDFPARFFSLLGRLDELSLNDAIVVHGWIHMPNFYEHFRESLLRMSLAKDEHEAERAINEHIFFTALPDKVLRKTVAFGGSVLYTTPDHEEIQRYGEAYRSFYRRVRSVYLRDVLSARKADELRSDYTSGRLGVDCATLLHERDIADFPMSYRSSDLTMQGGKIGVFFGRSNTSLEYIIRVVSMLSEELGRPAFALPWASPFDFQIKSLPFPPPAGTNGGQFKIGDQFALIRNSSVVVTDTYHVCVNALSMGVPAICVGGVFSKTEFDANSGYRFHSIDKRYLFYAMVDALEFYVHEQELADAEFLRSHVAHIARLVKSSDRTRRIAERIRRESLAVERALVEELEGIFAENRS